MTARINQFSYDTSDRIRENFEVSEKMFSTMENALKQIAESDPMEIALASKLVAEMALVRVNQLSKKLDLVIVSKPEVANA